ncbi:Tripartite tricarboxylate transporter TctB family protein [Pseudovibrio sp. Ad13]|uniref:tripartite tricarboxylate transporter TctB family protein n=1 Tax=unclassified Pseudovibrio TaxID=2627060 RepID=UPI0007AEB534|nr:MULTISPECIES: tripartite tricarboxylate transporter TctB family protein [unclassified Pseudovibrio]KZK75826.1 Tripartite tricarboxylate transporter TctB family protein [Pseudovibrio sp. Ad13]KZL13088.1 Tripartite tricarboxylate transporter TctB family protein [Pseudovibrio sp. Ad26]KZL26203.1 Tripartite tricarboxylate transporter TctB family protein [Pseudovibrio sp. Ad37]KZL26238.1 Tripartite tricarboxylate transporter TctB family protein [Pseudovibrio sp. WM33]
MALDRWIALVILAVSLSYGYTAFFLMDAGLPPFMRFNPIWPSTFPKVIAVLAAITSLAILLGFEKKPADSDADEIDFSRLWDYNIGQAVFLLVLMAGYALLLRPAGFLLSTLLFLVISAALLGERRFVILVPVAAIAAGGVWYLVQQTLGIYLSPLPTFFN